MSSYICHKQDFNINYLESLKSRYYSIKIILKHEKWELDNFLKYLVLIMFLYILKSFQADIYISCLKINMVILSILHFYIQTMKIESFIQNKIIIYSCMT